MTNWAKAIATLTYSKINDIKYKDGKRYLTLSCGHEFEWINKKIFPEVNERVACRECNNQNDQPVQNNEK